MPTETRSKFDTRVKRGRGWGIDSPKGCTESRFNAMRHGLTAMSILVPGETQKEFDTHLDGYIQRFQPVDNVEHDLVQTMAMARWRLRRVPVIESAMLINDIQHGFGNYKEFTEDSQRVAYAFDRCNQALSLLTRYEGTLNRTFERALKQLQELQKARLVAPDEKLRNETAKVVAAPRPAPKKAAPRPQKAPPADPGRPILISASRKDRKKDARRSFS